MAIELSYSEAQTRFASLLDEVVDNREVVIVNRRGQQDVAIIAAAELSSLVETVHLLRSPKNARRLLDALDETGCSDRMRLSMDKLIHDVGDDPDD